MAFVDCLTRPARYGAELADAAWPQFLRPLVLELTSHRPIREVLPGIQHWTAIHPRIKLPVDSYYIEPARVVLDPLVPREGLGWFVGRATPSQIVLTNRHHLRHSERYAEAFGCAIHCCEARLQEFENGPRVEGFAFGGELAPGITAYQLGVICPDDTALHIRTVERGALAFADGLTRPRGGGLRFMPGFLLGDTTQPCGPGYASRFGRCSASTSTTSYSHTANRSSAAGKQLCTSSSNADDPPQVPARRRASPRLRDGYAGCSAPKTLPSVALKYATVPTPGTS